MHKGIFVYSRLTATRKDNAFSWLQEEALHCGLELEICFEEDCRIEYNSGHSSISFAGQPMDEVEFVMMRTYNDRISRYYENKGNVLVVNDSRSMALSKDKLLTHHAMVEAGLPTPHTIYAPAMGYASLAEEFGSDRFMVKKIDGAKGENIFMVNSEGEFLSAVSALLPDCIFQEVVGDSIGRDIRVWVIGNECVGSVMRYSETSYLSNFSKGGKFAAIELNAAARDIAVRASNAVGLKFSGVDLLFCGDSYTVCEVNGNAGFRTISAASDVNIPRRLFQYIVSLLK